MRISSTLLAFALSLSLSVLPSFVPVPVPSPVFGDIYMHNMRGSNNRFNEEGAQRDNGNRLFDSENNARGGYNVGDRNKNIWTTESGNDVNYAGSHSSLYRLYGIFTDENRQWEYPMVYFEKSKLSLEWTNQHACGGNEQNDPQKVNCDIIWQYMCQNTDPYSGDLTYTYHVPNVLSSGFASPIPGAESTIQDGTVPGGNGNTPRAPTLFSTIGSNKITNDGSLLPSGPDNYLSYTNSYGRHESERYYYECSVRSRNRNLFLGDQLLTDGRGQQSIGVAGSAGNFQLNTDLTPGLAAIYTRQNPTGNRYGLECAEERDYYPYWSPSPWKDIAILTDRFTERCDPNTNLYKGQSQNNHIVYKCVPGNTTLLSSDAYYRIAFFPILAPGDATGTPCDYPNLWVPYSHGIPAPECYPGPWSRDNQLGNGRDGNMVRYNWTLPAMSDLIASGVKTFTEQGTSIPAAGTNLAYAKCVLRLRYNISSDDFDPDTINYLANAPNSPDYMFSSLNNNANSNHQARQPGVDPVDVGTNWVANLSLNVNMAQFGRVFQDRSHVFYIKQRPPSIPLTANIYNLNVRGKRCNIVECYPAVEYGFTPDRFEITNDDYLHVQWTGSNTHANNPDGGDGQAGQAGEGRTDTDRSNIAQILDPSQNYPFPLDKFTDNMWSRSTCYDHNGALASSGFAQSNSPPSPDGTMSPAATECALRVATSGLFKFMTDVQLYSNPDGSITQPTRMSVTLDDNPASLVGGVLIKFSVPQNTTYEYMNTRSNNFSNRGQKGTMIVFNV